MTRYRVGVLAAVTALVAAFIVAVLAVHVTPPSIAGASGEVTPGNGHVPSVRTPPGGGNRSVGERTIRLNKGTSTLGVVVTIAAALFVLAALCGVLLLGLSSVRSLVRPRGRYARRAPPRRAPDPEDVPPAVRRAVDDALAALGAPDVQTSDAIVAAWLALREAAAGSGVPSEPADTPDDLVRRVLARWAVRPDALTTLAELYREARFSQHRLGEAQRAAARAALSDVRADLAAATRA